MFGLDRDSPPKIKTKRAYPWRILSQLLKSKDRFEPTTERGRLSGLISKIKDFGRNLITRRDKRSTTEAEQDGPTAIIGPPLGMKGVKY